MISILNTREARFGAVATKYGHFQRASSAMSQALAIFQSRMTL